MTPNSQCWLRGSWRGRTFKIFIPQTPRKLSLRVPCSGRNGYCRLDHCWKLHQELPLVEGILQDYCLILVNLDPITGSLSSVQSLSRVWLCNPMNCSTPGLPVHHQLQESTQIHVQWVSDAIQPFHPRLSPSPPAQFLPASESFTMSQLFTWGGQNIGVSALAPVLPKNTQDWSPLGWTGWLSLQSKGLSRVFSNTTV